MEIEQIEAWKGQNVVDRNGEKIGKLEDVYFEAGSREPAFGCVKTGMLGRRHILVPLAGASVSRHHLRVAYQQDQVKDGPQAEPGATLEPGQEQELARHYDIDLTASAARAEPRYESTRAERGARSAEPERVRRGNEPRSSRRSPSARRRRHARGAAGRRRPLASATGTG